MPEINEDKARARVASEGAIGVKNFPKPHPDQRGPTCGFSALAYVMDYWYASVNLVPLKPLPARTNATIEQALDQPSNKIAKAANAQKGEFTSLRHFAKFNALTVVGSVFSAEDLATVARNAQLGSYDAKVVTLHDEAAFIEQIKFFLGKSCPVIVPYDVGDDEEPGYKQGNAAHWVAVLACVDEGKNLLYYSWGKLFCSELDAFAKSNSQLSNNRDVEFTKYEIFSSQADVEAGRPVWRDYSNQAGMDAIKAENPSFIYRKMKGTEKMNPEYNNPITPSASANTSASAASSQLALHASSSASTSVSRHASAANGGLMSKLVVVYPMGYDVAPSDTASASSQAATTPK
jgi:hypothetical protein